MTGPFLLEAATFMGRVCLGLVFVTAALDKLKHGRLFEGVIANYRILPREAAAPTAMLLPWAELALGLALLVQAPGPAPAALGIALLLLFAWAMGLNLKRGRSHIDCGCNREALRQTLKWSLVVRNLVLAALLAPALAATPNLDLPLAAAGSLAGAVAFLLYLLFNALAALPGLGRFAA